MNFWSKKCFFDRSRVANCKYVFAKPTDSLISTDRRCLHSATQKSCHGHFYTVTKVPKFRHTAARTNRRTYEPTHVFKRRPHKSPSGKYIDNKPCKNNAHIRWISMENSPPLVFQRSETRGEFSLARVNLVKIRLIFWLFCSSFSKIFAPAALFSEISSFFSLIRSNITVTDRPESFAIDCPEVFWTLSIGCAISRIHIDRSWAPQAKILRFQSV